MHYTLTIAIQAGTPVEPPPHPSLVVECEAYDDVLNTLTDIAAQANRIADIGDNGVGATGDPASLIAAIQNEWRADGWEPTVEDGPTIDDLVQIARHILGHAFPDKTFGELTEAEVDRVAMNLDHADDVLANIMPIVAEAS